MFPRRVYTCRTPETALKAILYVLAFAGTIWLHIGVDEWFRHMGKIGPYVAGKSFPYVASDTFCLMLHPWVLFQALPSLGEWFFLRLETDSEGLHYQERRGRHVLRGFASWHEITIISDAHKRLTLRVCDSEEIIIPHYVGRYRELVRDLQLHITHLQTPQSDTLKERKERIDDGIQAQADTLIQEGLWVKAGNLIYENSPLDLREAYAYVKQKTATERLKPEHTKPQWAARLLIWLITYAIIVLIQIFR